MTYTRYAIYVAPEGSELARFGARWLGWDALTGQDLPPPDIAGLPRPWAEITDTPRKYGFHGTIKPPFRLAEGMDEGGLREGFARFCAAQPSVKLERLELAQLGRFLALVPLGDTAALHRLAAETVRALDGFRAPLTEAEAARRRTANLSPRQEALLQSWGYPYVMEEFRFHLTLSTKLPKAEATALRQVLAPHLQAILPKPFEIDSLCLMGERPDGRFVLIDRAPLSAPV